MIGGAKQRGLQLNALESIRRADPAQPNHAINFRNPGGRPSAKATMQTPTSSLQIAITQRPDRAPGAVPPPPVPKAINYGERLASEARHRERLKAFGARRAPGTVTGNIL